jgi:hypothetical protein
VETYGITYSEDTSYYYRYKSDNKKEEGMDTVNGEEYEYTPPSHTS